VEYLLERLQKLILLFVFLLIHLRREQNLYLLFLSN
jgi:hypothetical protein